MSVAISGAMFVRADCTAVWAALHDVDVISRCVPGCRSLNRVSDRTFDLVLLIRLGPVRLAFEGSVEVVESDPPRRYSMIGRGTGYRAGDATGRATITLIEQPGGCKLLFEIEAETSGPLSAASPRLLSGIGKAIATYFAARFGELVGENAAKQPASSQPAAALQRA